MTTGENTDSIESENLTVTSDAAFERVTNDFKMEEENDGGFLKQNTAGLVQEIPNISFLDISDTMLESNKTLYKRENWIIRVGKAGRSIEAQPQDIALLTYTPEYLDPSQETTIIPFDSIQTSSNVSLFSIENNKAKIKEDGVYRISYGWVCSGGTNDVVLIEIQHYRNGNRIYNYMYDEFISSTGLNSGGKTGCIECKAGDELYMTIDSDSYSSIRLQGLYLEIQFLQYKL